VDIEHFQIIVNAMLSWQDEAHPPRKAPSRPAMAARPRDELDDDDEECIDEDDFEPEESLQIKPEPADADLSDSEQVD
jgi:hypothetical protein